MKKMIVIGAGCSGLSTGIYALKNGFSVTIVEQHTLPGGMCTSWKRKGYTFEGCFHYIKLIGATKGNIFYPIWKTLGALTHARILKSDILTTFKDKDGRILRIFTDPGKLERELLRISPSDASAIRELCLAIRRCCWFTKDTGINPVLWIFRIFNILLSIRFLNTYGELSLEEYSRQFKDMLVRKAVAGLFDYGNISCIQLPMFLGLYRKGGVGYPEGGSLGFSRNMAEKFRADGGILEYNKKVVKILVKDGVAGGILLDDGSIREADIVVSAMDAHSTLFELLEDAYTPGIVKKQFIDYPIYEAYIQVSMGIKGILPGLPGYLRQEVHEPFEIAGRNQDEIRIVNYAFDPTMSPPGGSSMVIIYSTEFAWWEALGHKSQRYKEEKQKVLRITIEQLEKAYPGFSNLIEVADVSTPLTTVHYTGNWKSALGFLVTKEYIQDIRKPKFRIPGLEHFYQTGQWIVGMGVPNAALGGKNVVREIIKVEGR